MNPFFLVLLSYLVGATPTSHWVGKGIYRVDLRTLGSGNLGATNAFRVLGWRAALPVILVDAAKGWLPSRFFPGFDGVGSPWIWALVYGGAAILGHVYSVWVGLRGGKGVATSGGVFLAIAPWAVLAAFGVWLATLFASRMVSLASILAALAVPLVVALTPHEGGMPVLVFTAVLAAFVVWTHRSNLKRILAGEERRFGRPHAPQGEGR